MYVKVTLDFFRTKVLHISCITSEKLSTTNYKDVYNRGFKMDQVMNLSVKHCYKLTSPSALSWN